MIYLASPYLHDDPKVMQDRYEAALDYAAQLIQRGEVVYSPIVHNHPIAVKHSLPRDWRFWYKFDEVMVSKATKLVVLELEGWENSVGVGNEILIARKNRIPVEHVRL